MEQGLESENYRVWGKMKQEKRASNRGQSAAILTRGGVVFESKNTGNYPVGTSECFNVGISGLCGPDCFVYRKGECEEPQEMLPCLDANGLKLHAELYGHNVAAEARRKAALQIVALCDKALITYSQE